MRGVFFRNKYGSEYQVFFGTAEQLYHEHGPEAVILRYEDSGEPYEGKQPSDYAKPLTEKQADEAKTEAKQERQPRGQMAATAAAEAMDRAESDVPLEPPSVEQVMPNTAPVVHVEGEQPKA